MPENTKGKFSGLKEKFSLTRKKSRPDNQEDIEGEIVMEHTVEETTSGSAEGSPLSGTAKYKQLLDKIVINGLLNIAEDKLSDDAFVESVFSKAYELLPVPVRLVVKREWCLGYLQSHKAPLLAQLQLFRAGKISPADPSALPVTEQIAHQALPPITP